MENTAGGMTFQNILPLILAILLIFLIPMLMRRYGLSWEDVIRFLFSRAGKRDYAEVAKRSKSKKEPWQTNGKSQDLQALASTLLMFARRNRLGLVYPGTVEHDGKMANLVALLVTRNEVVGINCFGFGGTITESAGKWNQHMNGVDQEIPDPLAGNHAQAKILLAAMNANGLADIPMRVVAVFTSRTVTLNTVHNDEIFDTKGLLEHLKQCIAQEAATVEPDEISRKLNATVKRLKPGKTRR